MSFVSRVRTIQFKVFAFTLSLEIWGKKPTAHEKMFKVGPFPVYERFSLISGRFFHSNSIDFFVISILLQAILLGVTMLLLYVAQNPPTTMGLDDLLFWNVSIFQNAVNKLSARNCTVITRFHWFFIFFFFHCKNL